MSIIGVKAAHERLSQLMSEALTELDAARQQGAAAHSQAAQRWVDKLIEFRRETVAEFREEEEAITAIDKKSLQISDAIVISAITQNIDELSTLSKELETLGAELAQQARTNLTAADRQTLLPIARVVDTLSDGIEEVRQVKKRLEQQGFAEQDLLGKMSAILAEYEALRAKIAERLA